MLVLALCLFDVRQKKKVVVAAAKKKGMSGGGGGGGGAALEALADCPQRHGALSKGQGTQAGARGSSNQFFFFYNGGGFVNTPSRPP